MGSNTISVGEPGVIELKITYVKYKGEHPLAALVSPASNLPPSIIADDKREGRSWIVKVRV